MGHIFNFEAVEIVGQGDDYTTSQVHEAWISTDCSANRHINLPPHYLVLRTFLTGDSHGAGQSGSSTIAASNEDGRDPGHGDIIKRRRGKFLELVSLRFVIFDFISAISGNGIFSGQHYDLHSPNSRSIYVRVRGRSTASPIPKNGLWSRS
nr:unnamed protein product [Spirometra erinaceieuropaei]